MSLINNALLFLHTNKLPQFITILSLIAMTQNVFKLTDAKTIDLVDDLKHKLTDNICLTNEDCNKFLKFENYCCSLKCCNMFQYVVRNE